MHGFSKWLPDALRLAFAVSCTAVLAVAAEPKQKSPDNGTLPAGVRALPAKVDPTLPNVLLIGDSISIGYTEAVRTQLAGVANVYRAPTNCQDSGTGAAKTRDWLRTGGVTRWHVIHFNFGLHDIRIATMVKPEEPYDPNYACRTSVEDYRRNLTTIVEALESTGAKLVWASTTPVPAERVNPIRSDRHVVAYNKIAAELLTPRVAAVDDLYAFVRPRLAQLQRPADVHYSPEGSAELGRQVAGAIKAQLPSQR